MNYAVTSNHIHLPVVGNDDRDVIPNSVKLIAGRTGQEYNQRKNRKGAFWEDRYHATAVENGEHLFVISYHKRWVEDYLGNGKNARNDKWTKSIAVGNRDFVERLKSLKGILAIGRKSTKAEESYQL